MNPAKLGNSCALSQNQSNQKIYCLIKLLDSFLSYIKSSQFVKTYLHLLFNPNNQFPIMTGCWLR